MRPGPPKGIPKVPGSGRKIGSPQRLVGSSINALRPGVGYVRDLMESLGINTFKELALAAVGRLQCVYCKHSEIPGKHLETILVDRETGEVRDVWVSCRACQGTSFEMIPANARLRALSDLNVFQQPRLSHATLDGDLKTSPNGETLQDMLAKVAVFTKDA